MSNHPIAKMLQIKKNDKVTKNICVREKNKRLQESDCVKWLKKRFKTTANNKYGLFEEESQMIKQFQFLFNRMSEFENSNSEEKQNKVIKMKQLDNIFKKYEIKGVDSTISQFFAKKDPHRASLRNGNTQYSNLPDLKRVSTSNSTPKEVNIRTLVELCMDEDLKPISSEDRLYSTLSPGNASQNFRPSNLKDALNYVYFKDKRDKIIQSINDIKNKDEITPELGTKFTMLFKTDLVKPSKFKRISFVTKKKPKKRRFVCVE